MLGEQFTPGQAYVPLLSPANNVVRFGDFAVDLHSGEVHKHGIRIKLQVQPFRVLKLLLERPHEVVTREELQKLLWPVDTYVDFDRGLNNTVKKLREALGDDAENPRYIETLSKRGYRFIGEIQSHVPATEAQEIFAPPTLSEVGTTVPHRKAFWWRLSLGLSAVVALALVFGLNGGGLRDRLFGNSVSPRIQSLAVLPLQNLSGDPAQEYFSDGMTDALITDLAQIGSLKVISRTSSMQYKQTKKSLPEIARELNVDGIVEGTVQRSGDHVRITAQLIHGPSDKHLWAKSYERDMHDVFTLEREVTDDIAQRVQAQLTTGHQPSQPRPVASKVLDAYLQGNYHSNKSNAGPRDEELRKAGNFFQQAIDADPNFAPAYIGLADAHQDLWWPSKQDFEIMRAASEKAVELDPSSSDARIRLGNTKRCDWDWTGAEEDCRRAIALNPNNAAGHEVLASVLDTLGQFEEGWKEHNIAQQLDPNEDHLSEALRVRGEYDRAIDRLKNISERRPEDGVVRWELSEVYLRQGRYAEWVEELAQTGIRFGLPDVSKRLQLAFATSGYEVTLRTWANELELFVANKQAYFPGMLADVYTAIGDKDRAFYWLREGCGHRRQAISDPMLTYAKVDPGFAPLRSDPRFNEILRCMGLPP